jgi:hypothetical protein
MPKKTHATTAGATRHRLARLGARGAPQPLTATLPSGRPLTGADPLELWEAAASPQGISGAELRNRTLAADEFLMEFFFGNPA